MWCLQYYCEYVETSAFTQQLKTMLILKILRKVLSGSHFMAMPCQMIFLSFLKHPLMTGDPAALMSSAAVSETNRPLSLVVVKNPWLEPFSLVAEYSALPFLGVRLFLPPLSPWGPPAFTESDGSDKVAKVAETVTSMLKVIGKLCTGWKGDVFLAVQDSSIGDLVSHSLTDWVSESDFWF